jgi:hypothetical protein
MLAMSVETARASFFSALVIVHFAAFGYDSA